ncbi:MAG: mechanosensitive ion channel family protein, partial [Butyrivibrio sp.]|nr:mechanosensitive ion channel family protein [Butyrivibrio sp.]
GMNMDKIQNGIFEWNTINGHDMYIYPSYYDKQNVWIACAVSRDEMINSGRYTMIVQGIAFTFIAAALVYYVILLLRQSNVHVSTDFTGSGKKHVYYSSQYKLFVVTVVISTVIMLLAFYLQTLKPMSSWAESSGRQTQRIQTTVELNNEQAADFVQLYDTMKKNQTTAFAQFLSRHEDLWTSDQLDFYSNILKSLDIQILGVDGKSKVGTNYKAYESDSRKPQIVEKSADYIQITSSQDEGKNIFSWMSNGRKIIEAMHGDDGKIRGYLYREYYAEAVDLVLNNYSLAGTLTMVSPGRNGFVFSVDSKEHTFTFYPESKMIGANALDYGITENQIRDNYCDYINIENEHFYASTDRIDNNIIFYVVAKKNLLIRRLMASFTSVLTAMILFLFIEAMIYTRKEKVKIIQPDSERTEQQEKSAEYKLMQVFKYYIAFAALTFTIFSYFRDDMGTNTVLGYVLDGNWKRGMNIFALTASIITLCRGGIVLLIASRLARSLGNVLPVRGGTIMKMLTSLCTYIAIGVLLYQCMLYFGLNPTALMASTGIIAVVLGIGANSLVGDILAGIFLMIEGNIQVGDVVKIGDFRGYVTNLGIRMTSIYDMDTDDVKIIPNNEVRNVVHMSMNRACVYSEFPIQYEEKLEEVEKILVEELSNVRDKSPFILEGPIYIGVSRLGDNGVYLKTATKCHEASRKKVEREVNHIVYGIFQKNNISVPYPQVTVHQGNESMIKREEK